MPCQPLFPRGKRSGSKPWCRRSRRSRTGIRIRRRIRIAVAISMPISIPVSTVIIIGVPVIIIIVISVFVWQRIPANIVVQNADYDQSRRPPTPSVSKMAVRRPVPAVIIHPASVMVSCPAPRLVIYPSPAVRRNPPPLPVTVRRPIRILARRSSIRLPDITVFTGMNPFAMLAQVFRSVNVTVVVCIVFSIF